MLFRNVDLCVKFFCSSQHLAWTEPFFFILFFLPILEVNAFTFNAFVAKRMCESDERIFLFQTAFQDITDSVMRNVAHKACETRR